MSDNTKIAMLEAAHELAAKLETTLGIRNGDVITSRIMDLARAVTADELNRRDDAQAIMMENPTLHLEPIKIRPIELNESTQELQRLFAESPLNQPPPFEILNQLSENDCRLIIDFMQVHGWRWAELTPDNVRQWAHVFQLLPKLREKPPLPPSECSSS